MISNIRTLLLNTSAITTLVGQNVFCDDIPQSVTSFPRINITLPNQSWFDTTGGVLTARKATVQIDVWGITPTQRESVIGALDTLLKNYTGSAGSITIQAVNPMNIQYDYDPPADGGDNGRFWGMMTLDIFYV